MKIKTLLITLLFLPLLVKAQYSTTAVLSIHQAYKDSLKQIEYNYLFPILGQGAYKKGFDIPYPAGFMGNFFWSKQGITIDNFELGLKTDNQDIPLTPVDFIGFGDNTNTAVSVNVRPDLWVLPFLNVYGIFGWGNSNTEVNLIKPLNFTSVVEQNLSTYGFGILGAGGVGPVWISVDANFTWNKPELLDEAVQVNVLGLRVGHTFVFNQKPDSNIAVWVGGMRVKMNSKTAGEIRLGDALPGLEEKSEQIVTDYNDWYDANYDDLSLLQKKVVDEVFDPIVDRIDNADGNAIIRYGMDKQVKELWNGLIGVQYQINKSWMLRSEAGLIGDRKSFLLSLNYRFLL